MEQYPWPNKDEIIPRTKGIRSQGDYWDEILINGFIDLGIIDEHGERIIDDCEQNTQFP